MTSLTDQYRREVEYLHRAAHWNFQRLAGLLRFSALINSKCRLNGSALYLENLIACAHADILRRSFNRFDKRRVGFPVQRNSDVNLRDLHVPNLSHASTQRSCVDCPADIAMTFPQPVVAHRIPLPSELTIIVDGVTQTARNKVPISRKVFILAPLVAITTPGPSTERGALSRPGTQLYYATRSFHC